MKYCPIYQVDRKPKLRRDDHPLRPLKGGHGSGMEGSSPTCTHAIRGRPHRGLARSATVTGFKSFVGATALPPLFFAAAPVGT